MMPERVQAMTNAPFSDGRLHLAWTGMETDLIFNRGVDLPGFASHPLVDTSEGRDLLRDYVGAQIDVARTHGLDAVLESPTWTANRDRGAAIGMNADPLARRNREAIALMAEVRVERGHDPVVLNANIGRALTPTRPPNG